MSKWREQGGGPGSTTGFAFHQALILLAVGADVPLGLPPGPPPRRGRGPPWVAGARSAPAKDLTLLARRKGKSLRKSTWRADVPASGPTWASRPDNHDAGCKRSSFWGSGIWPTEAGCERSFVGADVEQDPSFLGNLQKRFHLIPSFKIIL